MRTFLPHDILDIPLALIDHAGAHSRANELLLRMFHCCEAGLPLRPPEIAGIRMRPHLVADALVNGLLSPTDERKVLQGLSAAFVFRVMALAPGKLFARLSPLLLEDLESVERLLVMAEEREVTLPAPLSTYRDVLRADANRYYRTLSEQERPQRIAEFLAEAKASQSPAAAFFVVRCDQVAALPSPDRMAADQCYLYLLIRLLQARGLHADVYRPYVEALREPRWVFHGLRDGLVPEDRKDEAIEHLLAEPAWLIEYLRRAGASNAVRSSWAREAMARNENLREDLTLWLRSTSIREMVTR